MTRENPLWTQNLKYSARLDRNFIYEVMRRQNRVLEGWQVTPASGLNVNVAAGVAVILGTTQQFQGAYFVRSTTAEVVAAGTAPVAGTRTDTLVATVRDPDGGGVAGNDWIFQVVQGTVVPDNSVAVATIARAAGESGFTPASIVDIAPRGMFTWTVSANAPSGRGIPGDLWVRCS